MGMASKPTKQQIAEWKKNRKAWVKALRSGGYRQARSELYDGGGYCCLGVLCVTSGMKPRKTSKGYFFGAQTTHAPDKAMRAVGLTDAGGEFFDEHGHAEHLVNLNDSGLSFSRIADIIESEPEGLFRA